MPTKQEKNFSSIPNAVLDALPFLNLSEYQLKLLILIIRETYGFHRREAKISHSWVKVCTSINDEGSVCRTIRELASKQIIKRTAPDNHIDAASYQINEEFFKKVIHSQFKNYPKRGTAPQPYGGTAPQPYGGTAPQPYNKERSKETTKEIFQDVFHNLSEKTDYKPNQIERLREVIAKNISAAPGSEAVSVILKEQIIKTSQQRAVRDKFAYTLRSCQNLSKDLKGIKA